jgi:DNA-binding CsgD family transcriptional regulator
MRRTSRSPLDKLNVTTRGQAIAAAHRLNLISGAL